MKAYQPVALKLTTLSGRRVTYYRKVSELAQALESGAKPFSLAVINKNNLRSHR